MAESGLELYERGLACERAGDIPGAFEAFRRSARVNPRVAAPYVGLSRVLIRNQQRTEAIACLERAVVCEPANAALHVLLGQALVQDARLEQARTSYEQALRIDSGTVDAAIGIAGIHEDLGERAEAAAIYRRLLADAPEDAQALAGLLGVAEGEVLDQAVSLARAAKAEDENAALVGYALGKALARRGDHDAAFAAWENANAVRRKNTGAFDRDRFDRRIDRLIDIFSRDFFKAREGWGDQSRKPVFVVGLPRSGTTLTEQILASHAAVHGAGELDLLTDMATGTPDLLGRAEPSWPDAALELGREHVAEISGRHLQRLQQLAPAEALRIVDKQPLNFWHLGLVALTFPAAAIVHCTRDIRDNGLSVFAENFSAEQRWATDLSDIAYYWQGYRRLMDHWREVSGLSIIDAGYEDTVADIEGQARRLTDFLELPWDAAVLDFHTSKRAVQTPSRWQVRRPLYSSSSGRWRLYRQHLAPLSQSLEEEMPGKGGHK